jgi:hypothetical protein
MNKKYLLSKYGKYLVHKDEVGYKFSPEAYTELKEQFTSYLTDDMEIRLFTEVQGVIDAYVKLAKKTEGGMVLDALHRFGGSSRLFLVSPSFEVSPNVSYIKSVVESMKRKEANR